MAINPARAIGEARAAGAARAIPQQREDLGRRLHNYLSAGLMGRYFRAAEWQGRVKDLLGLNLDLGKVLDEVEAMNKGAVLEQAYEMIYDLHNRMYRQFDLKPLSPFYNLPEFRSFLERDSSGKIDIEQLLAGTLGNAISAGNELPDMALSSFRKACVFLRAALIVSEAHLPATDADRIVKRIVLSSDGGVSRIELCDRSKDLLLNDLVAAHFDNRGVISSANTVRALNELLGSLDPELREEMGRIDMADPDLVIREGASRIREYLKVTFGKTLMGLESEESDAEFLKKYFGIQNGENDLRQFSTAQLMIIDARRRMSRMKGESRYEKMFQESFSNMYYVLRAAELLAAREPTTSRPAPMADYIGLANRQYLLFLAELVVGRNERIKNALQRLNIPLPAEIRSAVEEAIDSTQQLLPGDRIQRMMEFADLIRKEHDIPIGDAIHDRPELYQRTFGLVDAAISAWSANGRLPNPAEIRTAMEMGLIFTAFIYS